MMHAYDDENTCISMAMMFDSLNIGGLAGQDQPFFIKVFSITGGPKICL